MIQQDPQLVHSRDGKGFTPLHYACEKGHVGVAAWLLGHGAHINEATRWGSTACHVACEGGHLPVVELLLGEGAPFLVLTAPLSWQPVVGAM